MRPISNDFVFVNNLGEIEIQSELGIIKRTIKTNTSKFKQAYFNKPQTEILATLENGNVYLYTNYGIFIRRLIGDNIAKEARYYKNNENLILVFTKNNKAQLHYKHTGIFVRTL